MNGAAELLTMDSVKALQLRNDFVRRVVVTDMQTFAMLRAPKDIRLLQLKNATADPCQRHNIHENKRTVTGSAFCREMNSSAMKISEMMIQRTTLMASSSRCS